ncbi:hypothetical protein PRUPE_3G155700, partial [Prunus persica]
ESPLADQTCIYRVPHKLFRHNEEAFVPSLVSIGPYHHGEKKLQAMEEMKLWYLHCLIERKPNQNTSLEKFVTEIRSMEQFCRDCYEEKFDHMSSNIFVEMMVVDGCFIIELFRKNLLRFWDHALLEIGVDFECRIEIMKPDLLDITLENGVMRIPSLSIGENGECFLRNLIAYEQCAPKHAKCYATSYAKLFSCLIKSTKDAEFLMEKGIIQTQLSKEDIACFFTRVCKDIEIEGDFLYFGDLASSVGKYCKRRWLRSWLTMIKRDYLYNPSSIWSVSSGVGVILILTITQTIYTVLSYYK